MLHLWGSFGNHTEERVDDNLLHGFKPTIFCGNNCVDLVLNTGETPGTRPEGRQSILLNREELLKKLFLSIDIPIPQTLGPLSKVVRLVACSSAHLLFATDNSCYAVGHGPQGQLGLGMGVLSTTIPERIPIAQGETPRSISVSDFHSCIVTHPHGYLYTFGCGAFYRLGHGTDDNDCFVAKRVDCLLAVGAWSSDGQTLGVEKVSCSQWHTAVLTTGVHDVYCWGWNNFGQVSDADDSNDDLIMPLSKRARIENSRTQSAGRPILGGTIQPKKKMIVEPERVSSLDLLSDGPEPTDEVIDLACGNRFTAFLTRRGHILVIGQMESNEIDHVDPGVDWWAETFASPLKDDVTEHPGATMATNSKSTPYTRSLRYLHQASLSVGAGGEHSIEDNDILPAVQLSAYQWSLAYLCDSTGANC